MKTKLSVMKSLVALGCLALSACFTSAMAQTRTVWVVNNGTFDTETLEKVEDAPVTTTCGAFSSSDYYEATQAITGIEGTRIFKFGGGVFTVPEGQAITGIEIYGWPRRTGTTYVSSIEVNGAEVAAFDADSSPYYFADCGEDVNSTNRTVANCTVLTIAEVSQANPVLSTFKVDIKGETHAFCKLTLMDASATSIQNTIMDEALKDNTIYDITGRKVTTPVNGIYIQGGKKIVVHNGNIVSQ